jgi:bifunctional polynucleotide phosphatase/kinase
MEASNIDKKGKVRKSKKIKPGKCIFPFKFKGTTHTECMPGDSGGWCPTSLTDNGYTNTWGYCKSHKNIPPKKYTFKIVSKKSTSSMPVVNAPWTHQDSCWYKMNYRGKPNICCFDFDDTLVTLRTSIPRPNVKRILLEIADKCDIVVFSNQKGISTGKSTNKEIQGLMDAFESDIGVPISYIYATDDDNYRKPMRGMYDLIKSLLPTKCSFVYYCGDAAGRLNDFSISDLYFANNVGLPFKTPEDIFQLVHDKDIGVKKIKDLYKDDVWKDGVLKNPRTIIPIEKVSVSDYKFDKSKKNLIIMVGPQGVGKSSLSNYFGKTYSWEIINGDKTGTISKQFKRFETLKKSSSGIIIDNTNSTREIRDKWISKGVGWNITLIYFNIPKHISFHMTQYRMYMGGAKMPSIPIHKYYKSLKAPSADEGTIITIENPISKEEFKQDLRFIWR